MFEMGYVRPLNTIQDFEVVFNTIVKGVIEDYMIPIVFKGVHVKSADVYGEIVIEIPLEVPEDKAFILDKIKARLVAFADELLYRQVDLNLRKINVKVLVNLLPSVSDAVMIKIKESEDKNMFVPEVKKIIHRTSNRGEFFTVVWRDDTTTTVKLMEGETSDDYTAFLYALGKKMFGDKGKGRAFVREKKEVFEEEMRQKAKEKKALRRRQAIQQSIDRECEDLSDLGEEVYGAMFVAPALIPKKMFKKNRGNE